MQRDLKKSAPFLAGVRKYTGQVQEPGRITGAKSLQALLLENHAGHCVREAAGDPSRLDRRLEEVVTLYKLRLA